VGLGRELVNGLALVADRRKLYASENLAVTVSNYPSGKLALGALLRGEVEMATVAQTPIVLESFKRHDLRIIAVLGSSDNEMKVVGRKDLGVLGPGDLKGKRVATQSVSSMHFFLHLYLLKHGMTWEDIKVRFVQPEELPGMLERGEVQAVSLREPFTSQVLAKLGGKAIVLEEPGLYVRSYCLVTTERMLREKPKAVAGVIRALLAADCLARREPTPVRAVLGNALGIPDAEMRSLWTSVELRICLPQALLLSMEDEARWVMSEHLTEVRTMPNFLEFLDVEPLVALRPDVVTVIR
jgi:NitT/TauT family transport system substrate-binding protein